MTSTANLIVRLEDALALFDEAAWRNLHSALLPRAVGKPSVEERLDYVESRIREKHAGRRATVLSSLRTRRALVKEALVASGHRTLSESAQIGFRQDKTIQTEAKKQTFQHLDWLQVVSKQSKPHYERITRALASKDSRSSQALVDELVVSLNSDERVVAALKTGASQCEDKTIPVNLISDAVRRCDQICIELRMLGAHVAFLSHSPGKALGLLSVAAGADASALSTQSQHLLLRLFVLAAWATQGEADIQRFLEAARNVPVSGEYATYLKGLGRLLPAKADLRSRRYDSAIRQCHALLQEVPQDDQLCLLALGFKADAFRLLGDREAELDALESWQKLCLNSPNGPCDLAVKAETSEGLNGIVEAGEILGHYSRLAYLYEQNPGTRTYARTIYRHFLTVAYDSWVDPNLPNPRTIKSRADDLDQSLEKADASRRPVANRVEILQPQQSYGRTVEQSIPGLLEQLANKLPVADVWLLIHPVELKERHFAFAQDQGRAFEKLCVGLIEFCKERSDGFSAERASAQWDGKEQDWIVLRHNINEGDVNNLAFGILSVVVGSKIEISMFAMLTQLAPLDEAKRKAVESILKRRPRDWMGYLALEDHVIQLVKLAARRLGQVSAGEDTRETAETGYVFYDE